MFKRHARTILQATMLAVGMLPILWAIGVSRERFAVPADETRSHTVVFAAPVSPEIREAYRQIFRVFERRNPDVRVVFEPAVGGRYESRLQTQILAGQAPDVFFFQGDLFAGWARDGMFLDLDDSVRRDEYSLEDFFPLALERCRYDGKLFALPMHWGTRIFYYNKSLFRQCGVEYDDDRWDWNTFLDAARRLTLDTDHDGRTDVYGCRLGTSVADAWMPVWANGGRVLSDDGRRCVIDSPEAREAVTWWTDLWNRWPVQPPSVGGEREFITENFFAEGKVAMMLSNPRRASKMRNIRRFEWGIAYMPKSPRTGQRATRFYSDMYVISARTREPEAAWRLLKFLVGETGQRLVCAHWAIPSRRSVANSAYYLREDTPWDERRFVDSIGHAFRPTDVGPAAEVQRIAQKYFDRILLKAEGSLVARLTVPEALRAMEQEIDAVLDRDRTRRGAGSGETH